MKLKGKTKGKDLFQVFVDLTGLDREVVEKELNRLLTGMRIDPNFMTTDDIRKVMSVYLDQLNLDLIGAPKTSEESFDLKKIADHAEA